MKKLAEGRLKKLHHQGIKKTEKTNLMSITLRTLRPPRPLR
jgi:hypothetical protein